MLTPNEVIAILGRNKGNPLGALRELGGYYECPRDATGKRLGPLVGYAGKDGQGRQYVGDVYANFAAMENWPRVLAQFVGQLGFDRLGKSGLEYDCICGAPLGGLASAVLLAESTGRRYIFPEKVVIKAAEEGKREVSKLAFSRHQVFPGQRHVIFEDVVNNGSTTEELISLIMEAGGSVEAIAALLNRSLIFEDEYPSLSAGRNIPIVSLVRKPIQQWQQDDPAVSADILAGKLVPKPKNDWDSLMQAMCPAG